MKVFFEFVVWREWPDLNRLQPLFLFSLRLWLAWVFVNAGAVKIQSWDSTIALFEYEYAVPYLSPQFAAVLATAIELVVPLCLLFGLIVRPAALILLLFNAIAMHSYPDISAAGIKEHQLWQLAIIVLALGGAGRYSLSHFMARKKRAAQTL